MRGMELKSHTIVGVYKYIFSILVTSITPIKNHRDFAPFKINRKNILE